MVVVVVVMVAVVQMVTFRLAVTCGCSGVLSQDSAPKEILIYTQLANACKMLAQQQDIADEERRRWLDDAVRYFTSAVDLDPKESNAIKTQIQELQQEYDAVGT